MLQHRLIQPTVSVTLLLSLSMARVVCFTVDKDAINQHYI